jgi:hypothetical protein
MFSAYMQVDWLIGEWVQGLSAPMHLGLHAGS